MAEIPGIYGLEFERRLVDERGAHLYHPEVLKEVVAASGVWDDGTGYLGGFDPRNGGKHYVDSHETDPDNAHLGNNGAYETATPETRSLRQLIRYARAADAQAVSAIQTYIRQGSETHSIAFNYRASLGADNVYGTHLNYGLPPEGDEIFTNYAGHSPGYFAQMLVNAATLTGAGAVHGATGAPSAGLSLSQKAGGVSAVQGRHGNRGTIYQIPETRGEYSYLQRVEVRLADSHPSEYGAYIQAGIGAIALTVAQLPQPQLETAFGIPRAGEQLIDQAKTQNDVHITSDGMLLAPSAMAESAGQTARMAELFLAMPRRHIAGEQDLVTAAEQVVGAYSAFMGAYRQDIAISELANKGLAWAQRATHVMAASTARGVVDFSHPDCVAADSAYDLVRVDANAVAYGPAFRPGPLPTPWILSEAEIRQATLEPPADTVAAYRTRTMRANDGVIRAMNWSRMETWRPDGQLVITYMPNPLNPENGV